MNFIQSLLNKRLHKTGTHPLPAYVDLYKTVYEFNNDAAFILNKEYQIVQMNKSGGDMLSASEGRPILRPFVSFVNPSERARIEELLHQTASGKSQNAVSYFANRRGTFSHVYISALPVRTNEADAGVVVIVKDLSALKQFEKQLDTVQQKFNQAQKAANIGVWDYSVVTRKGVWSKQLFRIFGMNEETDPVPSFPDYLNMLHPDDVETCVNAVNKAQENGEGFSHLARIVRKDGVQCIVQIQAKPYTGASGKVERLVATFLDVTNLYEVKAQLADKEKQVETIYNNLDETIWSIDTVNKKVLFCSDKFEETFGISLESILRNKELWHTLIHPDDLAELVPAVQELHKGKKLSVQHRFFRPSGEVRWVRTKCFPVLDGNGQWIRLDAIMWDITDSKMMEQQIHHIAYHDHLTALPNRRSFDLTLERMLADMASGAADSGPIAILLLDLDRFKHINDMLGHAVGDKLLGVVSTRLKECVDPGHFIARMGGDEFAVILNRTDMEKAVRIADAITAHIRKPYLIDEFELHVTTSIGVSTIAAGGDSLPDCVSVLKMVDTALYQAKKLGRNTYQMYTPAMSISSYKVYYLEKDMRKALENNEFFLEYQPKVAASTGEMIGAEALIRWEHPEWGRVSPSEFISIAEESELICDVGEWVIKSVCMQINEWRSQGVSPVPISINVSPQQLLRKNIIDTIRHLLHKYQVAAEYLEIEITETSLIQSSEVVVATIAKLKELGINISLDDFGVGYSSLTHLKKFDLDILKIDKSIIDSIPHKDEDKIILSGLIQMAHGLGLKVTAEGVESEDQFKLLQQKDCDYIQGFLFSKPVGADTFVSLLQNRWLRPLSPQHRHAGNRRAFPRVRFAFALSADLTITEFNGKRIHLGNTKILIEDISLGGIRFLSQVQLPVSQGIVLIVETEVCGALLHLQGHVVWKNERTDSVYEYGLQFTEIDRDLLSPVMNELSLRSDKGPAMPDGRFIAMDSIQYFSKM